MSISPVLRSELARAFPDQPRLVAAFEEQFAVVKSVAENPVTLAEATTALTDGTFVTLSPNEALNNERVLTAGPGVTLEADDATLTISINAPSLSGGHPATFDVFGPTSLSLPLSGVLATRGGVETFTDKTLSAPKLADLGNYANDVVAAAGGVPLGGIYHDAGALRVRIA